MGGANLMRARLSVVTPTLNAAGAVAPLFAQLAKGAVEGLVRELVVSDGGSTDDISEIAEQLGARFVSGDAGRGGQLRRGAAVATGEWLMFIHADSELPDGWIQAVEAHLDSEPDRAAVFRLAFDQNSFSARWVAGWANLRTRLFALPYGDQALLISRRLYDAVGGYPDIPIMEDVAIVRALGRKRLKVLPATLTTSAAKYRRDGWLRRGMKNWRCVALYFWGRDPRKILEKYQ
ncbi:MAG: TIGR04283 family arsenosugar biosynthesis glycosyltransferase [Neomegalonema sp.]|nr:TIGR04283 family arsenosugar biosynthesis glycosyltransferase [Neomegalonema sp.]